MIFSALSSSCFICQKIIEDKLLAYNCNIKTVMVSSRQAQHEVMIYTSNLATENCLIGILMKT